MNIEWPEGISLEAAMSILYRHEINCQIDSFWDAGWHVRLGDHVNGFRAEADFANLDGVGSWLIEQAIKKYP